MIITVKICSPTMDMGDGVAFVLVQWTVLTTSKLTNTMSSSLPWIANCIIEIQSGDAPLWKIWCPCDFNVRSDDTLCRSTRWEFNVRFTDYRCLRRFQLTDYRFRLSYRDPKDNYKYLTIWNVGENAQSMREISHILLRNWPLWGRRYSPSAVRNLSAKTALGTEHFLQSNWTSVSRTRLDLQHRSWWRRTPSSYNHRKDSNNGTLYSHSYYKIARSFPTWLSNSQQVTVIPVSNEAHIMLG